MLHDLNPFSLNLAVLLFKKSRTDVYKLYKFFENLKIEKNLKLLNLQILQFYITCWHRQFKYNNKKKTNPNWMREKRQLPNILWRADCRC